MESVDRNNQDRGIRTALEAALILTIGMGFGRFAYTAILPHMVEEGVLEPLRVVSQALQSASNVSSQLLRIDNILEMSRGPEIGEDGFNY